MTDIPIAGQIADLYAWALGIGALIALLVLIYGGIVYTTSAGNESRVSEAKEWLFGALIGLFILFGSYLILNTINPELIKLKDITLEKNKPTEPTGNPSTENPSGAIFVPPDSIATLPVASSEELRKQINPSIFAHTNDSGAVTNGCAQREIGPSECVFIDPKIWQLIVYLQNKGLSIRISSMVGTHSQLTSGGNVSAHWSGHAIDIDMINGKLVSGVDSSNPKPETIVLLQALLELRGTSLVPSQVISNGNGSFDSEIQQYQMNGGEQVHYVDGDHTDHVHVGY